MYFILNKKQILKFLIIILFALSTIVIIYQILTPYKSLFNSYTNIITYSSVEPTSSLPFSHKTIILDAGHGFPDGGASSNTGKIVESNLNLEIVLKLQKLLELSNFTVILTRSDENGIYKETADTIRKKKISDMENRVNISKDYPDAIYISIHMNKLDNSSVKGFEVFYSNTQSLNNKHFNKYDSKTCANYIFENLKEAIPNTSNNKKIKEIKNIYIIKHVEIPTTIVECGFLSNPEEEQLLLTDEYQNKLAWGIYTGILDYFSQY